MKPTQLNEGVTVDSISATEIRVKGKPVRVPSARIEGQTVIVMGSWLKVASIHEEKTLEHSAVETPAIFIDALRRGTLKADIFTFAQRIPETVPKHEFPMEWDNVAAIPITTYDDWFRKRAASDVRQNVKRALKAGVLAREVPFDDDLVKGIVAIYNESPIRQGRPFWHYGKGFDAVKAETAHCLERSIFIGAYLDDNLIGFIKLLVTSSAADTVLIVSMQKYHDKRVTNALISKAVEICAGRKIPYLTYAKFAYGNKANSSLAEFKRRNGFEQISFPRYYVPLTLKGRIATRLRLYRDTRDLIPEKLQARLLQLRAGLYRNTTTPLKRDAESGQTTK